ncbi:LysR family transcriptional regulator [Bradyrhizobium hipponense]|uniref:LysR family transcriptional regulator n=1 Tax=Bradyrhizobium hipponense TaxID=2605638 RepID=UPI001652ED53|nr:LysR family transcriptional regulator [Bradyrhizobium hipponense]
MNWDDLRFVLAVAKHGSLSAAARYLRTTQPTVGRRIAAFEAGLGTQIFRRLPGSLALTESGVAILERLERIETETLAIERTVSGRDAGAEGVVRVSAAEWFCARVLAAICAELSEAHPGMTIELLGESRRANLARGEADIAFRFVRFEQGEVVQRRLGGVGFGLYAAPAYLSRHRAADFGAGFKGHAIIAMRSELDAIADLAWLGEIAYAASTVLRTDSREAQAHAALAGAGLACLPRYIGDNTAGLGLVKTPVPIPAREIWMGIHAEVRDTPRVQAAAQILAAGIRKKSRGLDPGDRPQTKMHKT